MDCTGIALSVGREEADQGQEYRPYCGLH
jgi:hypothetical protein